MAHVKKAFRIALLFILLLQIFSFCSKHNEVLPISSVINWTATNGPYSGVVSSFVVSGNNLFAGTIGGGVFLSANNGTSWTAVNSGLTSTSVHSMAVSGTSIFAGTPNGVFRSTNSGTTWTEINTG